jgi:bile acid:Na+ symporter, BASS family
MNTNTLISLVLPLALAFMMFSLGVSLTRNDFKRVAKNPKPVVIGLFIQTILLPAVALGLCRIFSLSPDYSIGMMLLAASPGGSMANLFSHLAGGDVALNLVLTAINGITAVFFFPLIVGTSIRFFSGNEQEIGLPFSKTIEVFAIVLIPVALGILLNETKPALTKKLVAPLKKISLILLVLIIIGAIAKERANLLASFVELGTVILIFNLLSMGSGYFLPRFLKLTRPQSIAICMELGIHNATMAMMVAVTILGNTNYAFPAAAYSIIMILTAGVAVLLFKQSNP